MATLTFDEATTRKIYTVHVDDIIKLFLVPLGIFSRLINQKNYYIGDTRKTIDAKHQRAPFNSLCMCYMLDNKK